MIKQCPNCGKESLEEVAESGDWWWHCWECEYEFEEADDTLTVPLETPDPYRPVGTFSSAIFIAMVWILLVGFIVRSLLRYYDV